MKRIIICVFVLIFSNIILLTSNYIQYKKIKELKIEIYQKDSTMNSFSYISYDTIVYGK